MAPRRDARDLGPQASLRHRGVLGILDVRRHPGSGLSPWYASRMARGAIYRDLLGFSTELGGGLRASALRRPDGLYSVRGVAARLGLRSPRRGAGSRGTQVAIAVAAPVGGVSDAID